MKCRIAPALVTPVPGKFILKPHFRCDTLSPADKSAAPCCCRVCCLHSLTDINGGTTSKTVPSPEGPGLESPKGLGFLGPPESTTPSRSVHPFLQGSLLWPTQTQTAHATSVATGCIFALCACDTAERTGVNPAGDAGDTFPPNILVGRTSTGIPPPQYYYVLLTFGYSRPILVALRSLSLKPTSFGYKTPPIRFSQAGGQSAHKARPPNLELALTPLAERPNNNQFSNHFEKNV